MALSDASPAPKVFCNALHQRRSMIQQRDAMFSAPRDKMSKWDDARELEKFFRSLTDIEPSALSLVKPFDVTTLQPVAIIADTPAKRKLHHYFRCIISSSGQGSHAGGGGRAADYFLIDKTSGALLGIWSYGEATPHWGPFKEWAGGQVGGKENPRANHVVALTRCLPLFEFGDLTGGKLLALAAHSTDVLQVMELRYSFPILAIMIKTLHGKSSQYNRLHSRGIDWIGEQSDGRGLYISSLYVNCKAFLTGRSNDTGPRTTFSYADQVEHWRTRWLPNRLDRTLNGVCVPDPSKYRLSDQMRDRIRLRLLGQGTIQP